jgi:hypothetical protein
VIRIYDGAGNVIETFVEAVPLENIFMLHPYVFPPSRRSPLHDAIDKTRVRIPALHVLPLEVHRLSPLPSFRLPFAISDGDVFRQTRGVLDAEQIKWLRSHAVANAPVLASGSFFLPMVERPSQNFRAAQEQQACSICCKEQEYA